jgi:nucleoside 2-deoxyribosyltransferase
VPKVSSAVLKTLLEAPSPTITERANSLLLEAERGLVALGESFNINEPRFLAASYSSSAQDLAYLTRILRDLDLLEITTLDGKGRILPGGYVKLDEMRRRPATSSRGFVAMWFDQSMNDVYERGLQAGVLKAGYDPVRIDRVEHINRIDDEIIRQINASRFLVADFTGHRGGVYFEAGYALGKSLPVFWTCRKVDIGALHFDIRQFNCIDWDDAEGLANRLATRIEAVLGPGPLMPAK